MAASVEFVLASFNTHWGIDARGGSFDVAATAVGLDADVLILQEVWRPYGSRAWIDDVVADNGLAVACETVLAPDDFSGRPRRLPRPVDGSPPGTLGLTVLTRLPIIRRFAIDLGRPVGDAVARRAAACVEVEVAGRPLVIAGVHASSKLWGSPRQLYSLDRMLSTEAVPAIIAGDCNMWGPVLRPLLAGRRRAVRGRTFPGRWPHSQIDHIWVPDEVEVRHSSVSEYLGSDHRAVRATLALR